jgi:type II secretory ATPase GspE/PulE/Tfp pilus assembly ATPase PilB-like protein
MSVAEVPTIAPAQRRLESWCVQQALVLLEAVRTWRKGHENDLFENLLIQNYQILKEDRWLESAASIPEAPLPFPIPERCTIPPTATSPQGERLRRERHGIVIQDDPVLVIGIVNPFDRDTVDAFVSNYFPGRLYAVVSITPHAFVRMSSMAERGATQANPCYQGEDFEEWTKQLGFDDSTYVDTQAIVEDLWTKTPMYPVLCPHQYDLSVPLKEIPEAILIQKTATHVWVATPRVTDEMLRDRLYQNLSRKVIMLAMGPKEFARILQQRDVVTSSGVKVEENQPLVVRDWGIPSTLANPESVLFDRILEAAIRMGASDIHFEPKAELAVVRFRIDGDMITQAPISKTLYTLIIRRAKIVGGMRHEVTGIMQDGAGHFELDGKRWDMRYSVCVCKGGEESLVIRIFSSRIPNLEDLSLPLKEIQTLQWFLSQESGMFVSTGPTGSGKTTTLYACLKALDKPEIKIMTIEHPVEKYFEHALQIDVRDGEADDKHIITFQSALRTALRHDPDVIMIGEMRDTNSAQIAVQAALTGHLVLSTVHANDAVGVIERMCGSFGIDRLALGYALKLAVAQRLVVKLCPHCRKPHSATPEELRPFPEVNISDPIISERVGCSACRGTGSSGRSVIMEMLPVDSEITALIEQHASPTQIRQHNQNRGYTNLITQATLLLLRGEISLDEARTFLTRPIA